MLTREGGARHAGDAVCGAAYGSFARGGHLAHSYSARDLVPPDSPNAFGATQASLEDFAWAAGIEHCLAVAASASASADKG
jgi:hypothetical protein